MLEIEPVGLVRSYPRPVTEHSLEQVGNTPAEVSGDSVTARAELHAFLWQTYCRGPYQFPLAA